uniref:Uncharacterized protein LOC111115051 n=1 Tax=Crassostrea virginica TaxID=6565 RepID=A0A8B8C2L8_CRAVI|nr:uncharacterized protein LOC111115051 [Crassostrea virginica]
MLVFACFAWFCLLATVSCQLQIQVLPMPDLQKHVVQSQLFPLPQNRSPCRNGLCKGVSYDDITQQYKGLFFTEAELQNYTQVIQNLTVWSPWDHALFNEHSDHVLSASISRIQLRSVRNYHDGDKCCPTSRSYMHPKQMKNTRGQLRWIVHFEDLKPEPMYQIIPRVQCRYRGRCKLCVQEYALHNILVVDESLYGMTKFPFEFDSFYLKSYCSCKGLL